MFESATSRNIGTCLDRRSCCVSLGSADITATHRTPFKASTAKAIVAPGMVSATTSSQAAPDNLSVSIAHCEAYGGSMPKNHLLRERRIHGNKYTLSKPSFKHFDRNNTPRKKNMKLGRAKVLLFLAAVVQ